MRNWPNSYDRTLPCPGHSDSSRRPPSAQPPQSAQNRRALGTPVPRWAIMFRPAERDGFSVDNAVSCHPNSLLMSPKFPTSVILTLDFCHPERRRRFAAGVEVPAPSEAKGICGSSRGITADSSTRPPRARSIENHPPPRHGGHGVLVSLGFPSRPPPNSFSCALATHVWESPRWTPVLVKLLLPPQQNRGSPYRTNLVRRFPYREGRQDRIRVG